MRANSALVSSLQKQTNGYSVALTVYCSDVDYSLNLSTSMRTACARTQVTFGPCTSPCGSANGHRLNVYSLLYHMRCAYVNMLHVNNDANHL